MDTTMRRLAIIQLLILGGAICACCQVVQGGQSLNEGLTDEQIAKDYFLCMCLYEGYDRDTVFMKDHTMAVLGEFLMSRTAAASKLDSLARVVASSMKKSEYTNAKPIVGDCMKYYNSGEFEKIIKALKTNRENKPRR